MGLNINGSTITLSGATLSVKDSSANTIFTFDTSGRMATGASVPAFRAHNSTAGWVALTADTWNLFTWNSIPTNQGSHFSGNSFTAPVTGAYLFAASTYTYATILGHYLFPVFTVNGGTGGRRPGGQTNYRMRAQYNTAGHAADGQISDIYYLTAGDYVNYYGYSGGSTVSWYPSYSFFSGCLLG